MKRALAVRWPAPQVSCESGISQFNVRTPRLMLQLCQSLTSSNIPTDSSVSIRSINWPGVPVTDRTNNWAMQGI